MSRASLEVLRKAAEIQNEKGNDYQNPKSRIRQAMYYPRGCATILDTMAAKEWMNMSKLNLIVNISYLIGLNNSITF